MRPAYRAAIGITLLMLATLLCACDKSEPSRPPARQRTVIVGFDGMDPALTERWMDEGRLPNFSALRARGHYQRLATSNPPQSPVAWASFATGTDPGRHGIFDFLRRKPGTYEPDFSIAELVAPEPVELLGLKLSLGEPQLHNRRLGKPLWTSAEERGGRASVFRVPVTYPPDPVHHMIAGMGVPDLLGTQGTYVLVATRPMANADNGGRVLTVPIAEDGTLTTQLDGPANPWSSAGKPLQLPLRLAPDPQGVRLTLGETTTTLRVGEWSGWLKLRYSAGLLGSVKGMTRAHLTEGFPRPLLYLAPLQADPADPALPIASPPEFAAELRERIGDYHTLGMPEETWALNQGHLGEQAWLDLVATTLREGEAMLYDALDRRDSELVVEVFVQVDRVSHMFWRGLDPAHPLHARSTPLARESIANAYREADRVLGEVVKRLGPEDRLIVLSDHGFAAYRRSVHLNRWLVEQGYMTLKPGADPSATLFAAVDWSRTRAYALGLNGLFLNRRGREPSGIVEAGEAEALQAELSERLLGLRDPADQGVVVSAISRTEAIYSREQSAEAPDLLVGYAPGYRASWQTSLGAVPAALLEDNLQLWSGDHCIAPEAVPGVLFTSFATPRPVHGIADLAGLLIDIDRPAP